MPQVRLNSKSQVVLPARICRELGIQPGDLLAITREGDGVVLRKAPVCFVDALAECGSDAWAGYADELAEARDTSLTALGTAGNASPDLATSIHRRFAALGGAELDLPPRDPVREPPEEGC